MPSKPSTLPNPIDASIHRTMKNPKLLPLLLMALIVTNGSDTLAQAPQTPPPAGAEGQRGGAGAPGPGGFGDRGGGGQRGGRPNPAGVGLTAAEEQTKRLLVADGLEVTLFAAEPMVVNPTDMEVDARGRVWITEGANYRISKRMNKSWGEQRVGGDRIIILDDSNGDGKADKETTFYQDPTVNAALGICVLGAKVIVSSSPYVFILTDSNGDGKADKRDLLFEDNSPGDHDHCLHAFVFGPDGKLYFNFGNEIRELRRPKGGLMSLPLNGPVPAHEWEAVVDLAGNTVTNGRPYRQGMVIRCNLDGSGVEVLGHNFRNPYELQPDSFGTLWQSDNDDDGNRATRINFVMEFGNYGFTDEMTGASWRAPHTNPESEIPRKHWRLNDPGVVPTMLLTGQGSPTGLTVYEGKLLPAAFQNQVIHTDAGPRVVRAYPVEKDGAGYRATITNILWSSAEDTWFRPSDVSVAPDGSLYVADWNDANVGGHNMADQKLESMSGRILRVAPKGNKPSVPKLDLSSVNGAVAALQSPNNEVRYLGWSKLNEMQGNAEKELVALWKGKDARQRARALQLLARIKGSEKKYVEQGLKDADPDIRITALRIARERNLDLAPFLKTLVKDSSPQVRREAAIALRHNASADAPKLWAQLAQQHDGQDRWYLEALGLAADRQENKYFDAWLAAVGDKWNTPAGRDIIWRTRSTKTPALLAKIITDKSTPETDRARYFRALDFLKGPEKDAAMVELLEVSLPK
ncbi:MAG: PQQ-dependent sugar dehydrogenase [Opitutaceae bacterium]|nr:PQQ-dependent sugar dehydrogenase [Verrucomicrobiales bacterium]